MRALALLAVLFLSVAASATPSSDALRVFLRAGPKTHGPGEHDHPRFLAEWATLLEARGCVVDGGMEFPTAEQLARTDVVVMYAAEGGRIGAEERRDLRAYLERGGGIVALHDAVCGPDAHWFKTVIGGAWEHGHSKWEVGDLGLYMTGEEHPITAGLPHFELEDEIYYDVHLDPGAVVLANSFRTVFDVEPQAWVFEKDDYRAFVGLQGHYWKTFSNPAWRALVLRGIAWAGKREADLLLTADELAGLRYPPGGPTAPERAHASFTLHPEFEVELVAAEPDVVNPVDLDWDEEARPWVLCTPGYPYKARFSGVPAHDRLVILEERGGRHEVASVFHEGLDLATGFVFHRDGAIVLAAPDVLFLRDTDGDDVADVTETLFTGFGYGDTHATISNPHWGPDGWIYATQGYSGGGSRHVTGADGVDHGYVPNGIFRFRPDGSAIELVSSYGSNTWGLDFAPSGELFFSMANGSHARQVVLPEAVLSGARVNGVASWKHLPAYSHAVPEVVRESPRYRQIDFVGGFTAAAGALVHAGGAWPAEFEGSYFTCEPTLNLVHRARLEPVGPSWRAVKPREAEFLTSRDVWFRPVGVETAPDGALWVLDFYNQAIVHNDTRGPEHGPTNAALRPDRDRAHGRLWRVQHREADPHAGRGAATTFVRAGGATPDLLDRGSWFRERAVRSWEGGALVDYVPRPDDPRWTGVGGPVAALEYVARHQPDRGVVLEHVAAGLGARDEDVRAAACRALRSIDAKPGPMVVGRVLGLALDASAPRARLAALVALGERPLSDVAADRLVASFATIEDDWTRSALVRALLGAPEAALASAGKHGADELVEHLVEALAKRRDPVLADRTIVALGQAPMAAPTLVAALERLVRAMGPDFEPAKGDTALAALDRLLARGEAEVAVAALPVAGRWGRGTTRFERPMRVLCDRLLATLQHDESTYDDCLVALRPLLVVPQYRGRAIAAAPTLLEAFAPLDVQLATIDALRGVPDDDAARALTVAAPNLAARARDAAFDALLARPEWTRVLLDGVARGEVRATDLGTRRLHRLRTHPDARVAERARELFVRDDTGTKEKLAALLPEVSRPGDVTRGEALFGEHCGICHRFEGEGDSIGPDLTGMGAHGVEELLGVILDPNAEIDPAYVDYVARTTDGRLVTGIVVRETPESIVLRSTEGDTEVRRDELEELRSSGLSLMPTGLEELGADVLRDVLAYLTDEWRGYRVLDLRPVATARSSGGLFDPEHDWSGWRFARYGVLEVEGVPFEVRDPEACADGLNVLALQGGAADGWACRERFPARVELEVGQAVQRMHVLGGVGGWAFPWGDHEGDVVGTWTWNYADGTSESVTFRNGVEFADWIGRFDVPGSIAVEGLLERNTPGQLRRLVLEPRQDVTVDSIVLESARGVVSPVFLALTVELPGTEPRAAGVVERAPDTELAEVDCWLVGGGSSHDFERWFGRADTELLASDARKVHYTERPADLVGALDADDVLVLSTNQALSADVRATIDAHLAAGGALVALHPGTWTNWPDWNAFAERVAYQSRSHEPRGRFEVRVADAEHPVTAGVAPAFRIVDELYRAERAASTDAHVLCEGVSPATGERWPVAWTVGERVVGLTLGHDGRAHEDANFRRLLANAVAWLER